MHRFRFSLAAALVGLGCLGVNVAEAQEEPYGEPEQGQYDDPEQPYDDPDAPYDEYDDSQGYDDEGGYADDGYDSGAPPDSYQDAGSVDTFYDSLSPYGRWVRSPDYGLIWVPSRAVVGASFVPYATGGSWQYTDVGWMFNSDWNWGWAPFHYGRWYLDPVYGWVWVPGRVWAPAWVDWRFGGGMIGWAPLPPRHHRTTWVFCNARDIYRPQIHRYVVRDARRYFRVTAPVRYRVRSGRGRAYWYSGPRGDQIERVARIRVRPIRVRPPRAGVVARLHVQGGRVREERLAPPRHRVITQSRRELPRQRPGVRQRPDVRGRPDDRQRPGWRGRPDDRQRPEVRQRPDMRGPDRAPDRGPPPRVREERAPDRGPPPRVREQRAPDRERPAPQQPQQQKKKEEGSDHRQERPSSERKPTRERRER